MKLYAFSLESVEYAEMLDKLGFTVLSRNKGHYMDSLIAESSTRRRCELDSSLFPEIKAGESVDIRYIINFAEINDFYETRMRGHS